MCTTCGCSSIGGVAYTTLKPTADALAAEAGAAARADPGGAEVRYRPLGTSSTVRPPRTGAGVATEARGAPLRLHSHAASESAARDGATIVLEQEILAKNRALAARNGQWLAERNLVALNLMSSPGAGKTSLLERTIRDLAGAATIAVIEGDQATQNDAERIARAGARVVQVNTGTGCHLEADMLARALDELAPPAGAIVMIENVGNLVCPALFELGESARVVILSITEGEDKPLKYPHMFRTADLLLLNKMDLLPHLDFDLERCIGYALEVNPRLEVRRVSARTGEGMAAWYEWLRAHATTVRAGAQPA